jgi:putative transcriptional regulator
MGESGKRESLFSRLQSGLEEGIQFTRGALNLRTTLVPVRPPKFLPKDVIRLRKRINISQVLFARMLNVSAKTVQSWEQ